MALDRFAALRRMRFAIFGCRFLAILFLVLGGIGVAAAVLSGGRTPMPRMRMVLSASMWIGAGAVYLLLARSLNRHRFWACVATITLTSMLLIAVTILILRVGLLVFGRMGPSDGSVLAIAAVILAVCMAVSLLNGAIVYHLGRVIQSFPLLAELDRGFEVLPLISVKRVQEAGEIPSRSRENDYRP
jgi:hypothetical protein